MKLFVSNFDSQNTSLRQTDGRTDTGQIAHIALAYRRAVKTAHRARDTVDL